MTNFIKKDEEFYFWDDMWNKSNEINNEKDITKDGVEDPSLDA